MTKHLLDAQQGHRALMDIWASAKPWLLAGHRFELEIRPERRNTAQSARFHAICSDLERSRLPWFGSPRDAAAWKVLLISGHAFATKEPAQVIPGIEGELVNVRESSALMSKARSASLIEYAESFCIANDVTLHDPQSMESASAE